jgi:hypothetical protein
MIAISPSSRSALSRGVAKASIAIPLFVGTASAGGAPVGPQATIVYANAFYKGGEPQWDTLPITQSFSSRTLAALPRTKGTFVMLSLHCAALKPDGRLAKCRVESEPKDQRWLHVAEMMSGDLRSDSGFAKRAGGNIEFVHIQVRASNSETVAISGPCWPPTCNIVPAPPPPPPPPQSD